jgi:hypothetical protein
MNKEYVFIFRDDYGNIVAVNKDFEHGLTQALEAIGNQKMLDPKTGNIYSISTVASAADIITYRNIDDIFDYNLSCIKWLVSD